MDPSRRCGAYQLLRKIGAGGMGEIYLARREQPGGPTADVVVKRLPLGKPEAVSMFENEVRIASSFRHQNLPVVFEAGWDEDTPFYVMEYLQGLDCREILKALRSPLPLQHLLTIGIGAASGLHYAHAEAQIEGKLLRIVHRDVSPSNILITRHGEVKVVDFGVARANLRTTHTTGSGLKGTIAYMSPEQALGNELDHRSDIFSLGSVLYELASRVRPFDPYGETELFVLQRIADEPAPPLRDVAPHVPEEIAHAIHRCLERDPARRFPSADHLAAALEEASSTLGLQVSSRKLGRLVEQLQREHRPSGEPPPRTVMRSGGEGPLALQVTEATRRKMPVGPSRSPWRRRLLFASSFSVVALAAVIAMYVREPMGQPHPEPAAIGSTDLGSDGGAGNTASPDGARAASAEERESDQEEATMAPAPAPGAAEPAPRPRARPNRGRRARREAKTPAAEERRTKLTDSAFPPVRSDP